MSVDAKAVPDPLALSSASPNSARVLEKQAVSRPTSPAINGTRTQSAWPPPKGDVAHFSQRRMAACVAPQNFRKRLLAKSTETATNQQKTASYLHAILAVTTAVNDDFRLLARHTEFGADLPGKQATSAIQRNKGDPVLFQNIFAPLARSLVIVAAAALSTLSHGAVIGVDLGTAAPPNALNGLPLLPFDRTVQNALLDNTTVTSLATPIGGDMTFTPAVLKFSVPTTWATWSHGYTGAVFEFDGTVMAGTVGTLTMPPNTTAFSFYFEPGLFGVSNVTVTTSKGGLIGPTPVNGTSGANGFGFYTTDTEDYIETVTITSPNYYFAVAEFSISDAKRGGAASHRHAGSRHVCMEPDAAWLPVGDG